MGGRNNGIGCQVLLPFILFLLIVVTLTGSVVCKAVGGANIAYSEGSRSGTVQKFSKKGLIWTTWEGELNLGYNVQTQGTKDSPSQLVPAIFLFSCSSDDVAKQIMAAERSGKRVTLEYKQYILRGYDKGSTGYDVTGISQSE